MQGKVVSIGSKITASFSDKDCHIVIEGSLTPKQINLFRALLPRKIGEHFQTQRRLNLARLAEAKRIEDARVAQAVAKVGGPSAVAGANEVDKKGIAQ